MPVLNTTVQTRAANNNSPVTATKSNAQSTWSTGLLGDYLLDTGKSLTGSKRPHRGRANAKSSNHGLQREPSSISYGQKRRPSKSSIARPQIKQAVIPRARLEPEVYVVKVRRCMDGDDLNNNSGHLDSGDVCMRYVGMSGIVVPRVDPKKPKVVHAAVSGKPDKHVRRKLPRLTEASALVTCVKQLPISAIKRLSSHSSFDCPFDYRRLLVAVESEMNVLH